MLLELGLLALFTGRRRTTLADFQRHVSIVGRGRRRNGLFVQHVHVASREDTLEVGALITTTPPYKQRLAREAAHKGVRQPYSRHSCVPRLEYDRVVAEPSLRGPSECRHRALKR